MSHQDDVHLRKNIVAIKGILEDAVPDDVASFVRHGNAQLDPAWLSSVAMTCWGWTTEGTLTERVSKACTVVGEVLDRKERVTRQGLMKALSTCGPQLVELMNHSLADHIQNLKGYWTQKGKVNIAVDGSKFAAPRTAENQAYFAATGTFKKKKKRKKYKKASDQSKASTVQVLLTIFWHMQSGLPLRWMTSASNGSERRNAAQMLDDLPRNARMIGDAEYVGYPLWSKIHNSGRSFLVRVGSNLTFLKQLGKYRVEDGFVYYWPEGVMRANDPPLVLRLIQIRDGKKAIFLVTNELDMDDELACELYSGRWKIEMFFRTVKQTCERAKLHCHRPENVLTELNWTLLGIWYALFTGKQVLLNEGLDPTDVSPVKVMKAISKVVEEIYRMATPISLLQDELAKAALDDESDRTSSKASRNFPKKKKHRTCGVPKIKCANSTQRERAKILRV
jgi:hypothetical protein